MAKSLYDQDVEAFCKDVAAHTLVTPDQVVPGTLEVHEPSGKVTFIGDEHFSHFDHSHFLALRRPGHEDRLCRITFVARGADGVRVVAYFPFGNAADAGG